MIEITEELNEYLNEIIKKRKRIEIMNHDVEYLEEELFLIELEIFEENREKETMKQIITKLNKRGFSKNFEVCQKSRKTR